MRGGNKYIKGKVGEEIAAKIAEEKLKAIILDRDNKLTNVDMEILIDDELGIIEVKFASDKQYLVRRLAKATEQIYGRFEQSDKYKRGVAFSVYVNKDTGQYEYVYRVITRETQDKALDQLPLTTYWTGKVREQGVNAGNQNQPMAQTFAGFSANQIMVSDVQYGYQHMVGTKQDGQQQQWIKTIGDTTNAQSTISNSSAANKQDTTGAGSKQWSMVHSQSKQQGPSNQSSEPPINVKKQEQGGEITSSDPKKASVDDSSKTSKARDDKQQTTFEGREGSGKPMAQQAQQRQQQRQQAKKQGDNTTKNEAKPPSSDKNGKNSSQQGQQTQNRGSETAKDNNRPAPSNSDSGSKGAKDPDTKNCAPSRGGGPKPI